MNGRGVGGLIGSLLGFFGGFIAFTSIRFAERPGTDWSASSFFLSIFGGLVVGGVIGALLGGWLNTRGFDPMAKWRPRPRQAASSCLTVAGAVVGWIFGGVMGLISVVLLGELLPTWAMPVVFFSPPVLGLILGGVIAVQISSRRAES